VAGRPATRTGWIARRADPAAAGLCPAAIGTETESSIVYPAAVCGVVGVKPTVGLTSRAGVIPVTLSADSVGPLARTVADAAAVLAAMARPDALRPTHDRPVARVGVPRQIGCGNSRHADAVAEAATGLSGHTGRHEDHRRW
jgi:amidase